MRFCIGTGGFYRLWPDVRADSAPACRIHEGAGCVVAGRDRENVKVAGGYPGSVCMWTLDRGDEATTGG